MFVEEESTSSPKDVDDEQAVEEQNIKNRLDDNIVKAPEVGMHFDSLESLFEYYKLYGKQEGFRVKKKTSRLSIDGKLKFVSLSCSRAGKSQSSKQSFLVSNASKMECKARVNATIFEDGKCKINSVVLEHNHGLGSHKSGSDSCNKEIITDAQTKLELNDGEGIDVMKNCQSVVLVEARDHDTVPFIEKAKRLCLGVGDAEAIHDYFVRMQAKNPNFFYMADVDDSAQMKNLFWADARSRLAYEEFGDVVTFDTTYLTNKYDTPFVVFVGVNHHGQSILFGCGLLSRTDATTYMWLLKTWLVCMSGRAPNAIITDQDKALQKAVKVVFPNTRHRWCLWNILKNLSDKLKAHRVYEQMKNTLLSVIYDSLTKEEFEENWRQFVNDFSLHDNVWLSSLYEERHHWVPAFVKDNFWAGMSTIQRNESMNFVFDGYVNFKTTLKQFIQQYDNVLRNKIEKENRADFHSFSKCIPCVTLFEMEKQFQAVYTNAKFKEFQKELTGKLYCEVSCVDEKEGVFDVLETVFVGERRKEVHFNVHYSKESCEVKCSCCLFEFRGILCKHIISVFMKLHIINVPAKYILPRWRKDLRRCYTRVRLGYDDFSTTLEAQRYHKLQLKFEEVADWAVVSNENFSMLWNWLDEFQSRVKKQFVGAANLQSANENIHNS